MDTGTVDAAVPGGAKRLLAAPRLRDFLVNMDFTTQKWSVHLYEGFMVGSSRYAPLYFNKLGD